MAENKKIQTPSLSIQKSYLRQPVETKELKRFRLQLAILLKELNANDIEEANKGRVKTFLEQTLWPSKSYEINASGKTDLTIKDKNLERNVVMFEFKKVKSPEMVTKDDLSKKAMFELVLYYILEEHENHNNNIKHLILSDGYKYFIFEKGLFWDLFGRDKTLVHDIISSEHTSGERREYIYNQIIRPKVEAFKDKFEYTFVDLEQFAKDIDTDDIITKPKFKALYKLFSPIHLQRLPFSEDHNTLNKRFYTELLYIMGLEEQGQKHQIQRLKQEERQPYSLLEQAYTMLADYELNETAKIEADEDKRFETALGLVIVWINRTLFMKLLESQLIAFNSDKKKYAFFEKITDFAMMHYLFCKVMAIPESERSDEMKEKFGEVPYLNSSLFELTDIEKRYFPVSSLRNSDVKIMKRTCLKDKKGKVAVGKLSVLDYLKQFLDSYDFGADAGESGKTIINASVLGLIFEKINGYKEGSFFTPGYITSYLCRETLRRCITDKYNEKFGTSYADYSILREEIGYPDKQKRQEINGFINSLTICDPAVGSGHFIVSALNELIAIKSELNILQFCDNHTRFDFKVTVEDDELIVMDEDGEVKYNPQNPLSQKIQQTLFEEKRTIIENCLFGVDINPNSAEICQLRLWIELLKHAYYMPKGADGKRHLQTLPNIDINIKCGNSLVMKYSLDAPIDKVLRGANVTISDYRKHVADYKNCPSKENKHVVEQDIMKIKANLDEGYDKETDEYKTWVKVCSDILTRDNSLFPPEEAETKALMDLRKKEAKLRQSLEEVSSRHARLKAFEWRYEFPEVLNGKGQFDGFDCIIGNPPYGISIQGEYRKTVEEKYDHMPDYEIYCYFIALGHNLLKDNGYLAYIIPNMWLFNVTYENYRTDLINDWNIVELLDCTNFQIFDSATVRNTVVIFKKTTHNSGFTGYRNTRGLSDETEGKKSKGKDYFSELIQREYQRISNNELTKKFSQSWGLALSLTEQEKKIVTTIDSVGSRLNDFFDVTQGYIPYRLADLEKTYGEKGKLIMEEQRWHSDRKIDESYQIEIKGENINKFECRHSGVYVKYGKHVGTYVDMKFFESPRLLVREIINPLMACYVEDTYVNDPGIINIIKKDDNGTFSLKVLWCILNSKLSTYFLLHFAPKASKGLFPKVLITDMNKFPLPKNNDNNKSFFDELENCYEQIFANEGKVIADHKRIKKLEEKINNYVFKLYGIEDADINIISEKIIE